VQSEKLKILFASGGTGGHLFPAIAVADEIRQMRPDAEITFVGTRDKIEARVVPTHGYRFEPITISGFKRKLGMETFRFPVKVLAALVQSVGLIRRLRPNVVVGTGGYVCGPVVLAATFIGVPALLHEQNSYPGVTTRMLSALAREVHVSFEATRKYLRRPGHVVLSGNPTRKAIGGVTREEGARVFGLSPRKKTLLIFGGSLGAHSINNAAAQILTGVLTQDVQVIWQTGEQDYEAIARAITGSGGMSEALVAEKVRLCRFIERMECAYAVSDLALCRSGATTVAELTRAGLPAVLVPYPFATADHQTENAKSLAEKGAAVMIKDSRLNEELSKTVHGLLADPACLARMSENARSLARPAAAADIARAVIELARPHDDRTGKGL
jgi:UDP-N-acetylglucosamine--N-acetylmuramyl-(pentapeptide) pyrophosphoryl-undecaprenol N-acetylglucosamine transferase